MYTYYTDSGDRHINGSVKQIGYKIITYIPGKRYQCVYNKKTGITEVIDPVHRYTIERVQGIAYFGYNLETPIFLHDKPHEIAVMSIKNHLAYSNRNNLTILFKYRILRAMNLDSDIQSIIFNKSGDYFGVLTKKTVEIFETYRYNSIYKQELANQINLTFSGKFLTCTNNLITELTVINVHEKKLTTYKYFKAYSHATIKDDKIVLDGRITKIPTWNYIAPLYASVIRRNDDSAIKNLTIDCLSIIQSYL